MTEFDKDLKGSSKATRAKLLRDLRNMLIEGDDECRDREATIERLNVEVREWRRERPRIVHEVSRFVNYVPKKKV